MTPSNVNASLFPRMTKARCPSQAFEFHIFLQSYILINIRIDKSPCGPLWANVTAVPTEKLDIDLSILYS